MAYSCSTSWARSSAWRSEWVTRISSDPMTGPGGPPADRPKSARHAGDVEASVGLHSGQAHRPKLGMHTVYHANRPTYTSSHEGCHRRDRSGKSLSQAASH